MFLTQDTGWLGPITYIFGILMNYIYEGLNAIGIGNIGLAIIIFTLITRILLTPMTIKQQKSSKLMTVIQPEIQAIQAKYQNKQDQESQIRMQQEMKATYDKYGTSMTGGCLQLLIQMPIIIALYRVIMNVPAYVSQVKNAYINIINVLGGAGSQNLITKLQEFGSANNVSLSIAENEIAQQNFIIDFLYKLNPTQFTNFLSTLSIQNNQVIEENLSFINRTNAFLGLNLATQPSAFGFSITPYLIIPLLAGLAQYISAMYMQKANTNKMTDENSQMNQTMKTMNIMMPIMSIYFCWQFATGIGIYWIASSIFMMIQQIIINNYLDKMDLETLIRLNVEKANKKRVKKGLPLIDIEKTANSLKNMETKFDQKQEERTKLLENSEEKEQAADKYYFDGENKDSLFSKVNMVKKYNEKNKK